MKSKLNVAFAAVVCALALSVGDGRAAPLQLDVAATMVPTGITPPCSPTCTLGGFIVIDNTVGSVTSADVTMSGESPSVGPFTNFLGGSAPGDGTILLNFNDGVVSHLLQLNINSGGLIGYNGGPLAHLTNASSDGIASWALTPGTGFLTPATPSAVPLPGALPLFATGLGALGLLGWRRKRKAQAAA